MTAVIQKPISQLKITWPLLPDDFILPDDPVENIEHPLIANGLRQSVVDSELIQDALIVSNFALCAAVDDRTICKAPDWMYVRPVQCLQVHEQLREFLTCNTMVRAILTGLFEINSHPTSLDSLLLHALDGRLISPILKT